MPTRNVKKLENHLTLHGWINRQFGYNSTQDLLSAVKDFEEGFTTDGYSEICKFLLSRPNLKPVIRTALPIYDANIKRHLSAINNTRTQPIVLRYFQYLALLYTEIFLDWKFNKGGELLRELKEFTQKRNDERSPGDDLDTEFEDVDLEKLAFWMATGAGKTLIMHMNYHQYLHYCRETLDHIVLITPNEGLSEQHRRELENSDIRCDPFNVDSNNVSRSHNTVQVIEITKLVEEKTDEGESVPVEAFEGNNLILVDEGHKGSGGEVWRKTREMLAETGFTFEYSATFGQALSASKNADLVDEYGKSIIFDYSYRYFYGDGYGKNFRILNVRHDVDTQTKTLLLGNLLSFYEQCKYFEGKKDIVRDYGLEPPLWAFVGSKVNAVYTKNRQARSDVLNVIQFLHQFLRNEKGWAIKGIQDILNGRSGLSDDYGKDVFSNRLNFLKDTDNTAAQIYKDILNEVFHAESSGGLQLYDVRNSPGEIGLKTTSSSKVFGVIYIGDTSAFKKLVRNDNEEITVDSEDVLTDSLFNDINRPDSDINILIGAKKFIEGWDSWRVTAMGLLNIGQQEGSQIIQLFGRGVRLRGKDMCLKRSSAIDGEHPPNLPLLETLNIFAVRANFMAQFRDYLLREGVEFEEKLQLELPIFTNTNLFQKGLLYPKAPLYDEVAKGQCVPLEVNRSITVIHNTQSVEIIQSSSENSIQREQAQAAIQDVEIPDSSLNLIDWEWIRLQLLEYKQEKHFHNLVFDIDTLRTIVSPNEKRYKLFVMNESEYAPRSKDDLKHFEELVLHILRKYIAKYYRLIQQRVTTQYMEVKDINEMKSEYDKWNVSVSKNEYDLIESLKELKRDIKQMIKDGDFIYGRSSSGLPKDFEAYIECHLFQPLLTVIKDRDNKILDTSPPALEKSEHDFVTDLRNYLSSLDTSKLTADQVFLLRNQSRGKGIGFYENEGFYPDFILWLFEKTLQRIIFIEPHGMIHDAINEQNDKVTQFRRMHAISNNPSFLKHQVKMDSYIISNTDFSVLSNREGMDKDTFADEWHILFRTQDPNYLSPIFQDSDNS